ncbi:MAG: hypothetical protein ACTSRP_27365 [Candidatus Helarchaeota archaeon]
MSTKNKKKIKLDKRDIAIISIINRDNRINLSKIAKELNVSHVSIGLRLNKLLKNKIIDIKVRINPKILNINLGFILLEIETSSYNKLLKIYKQCPRVIGVFDLIGEYNLGVFFFAENPDTFKTILKFCMLYSFPSIRKSTILTIGDHYFPSFVNIRLSKFIKNNIPCNSNCNTCDAFLNNKCLGCPNFIHYKGNLKIEI